MFFGTTLLIIGIIFLLQNLGLIAGDVWSIIWPVLLIALGASFLFKKRWHACFYCGRDWKHKKPE